MREIRDASPITRRVGALFGLCGQSVSAIASTILFQPTNNQVKKPPPKGEGDGDGQGKKEGKKNSLHAVFEAEETEVSAKIGTSLRVQPSAFERPAIERFVYVSPYLSMAKDGRTDGHGWKGDDDHSPLKSSVQHPRYLHPESTAMAGVMGRPSIRPRQAAKHFCKGATRGLLEKTGVSGTASES